jgi:hypothetical protein
MGPQATECRRAAEAKKGRSSLSALRQRILVPRSAARISARIPRARPQIAETWIRGWNVGRVTTNAWTETPNPRVIAAETRTVISSVLEELMGAGRC